MPLQIDFVNLREPATGIVHIRVHGNGAYGAEERLKLRVDGETISESPAIEHDPGKGAVTLLDVGLHSTLLASGRHEVVAELWKDGAVRESANAALSTLCEGPVAEMARDAMRAANTPLIVRNGAFDSNLYPYDSPDAQCWFDRPDAPQHIAAMRAAGQISDDEARQLTQFVEQGYIVLDGVIEPETIARVNAEIDDAVARGWEGYSYGSSQRIAQLHREYPEIRKLWQSDDYLRWVRLIFQDCPSSEHLAQVAA